MTSSTLPAVLLNNHANTTDWTVTKARSDQGITPYSMSGRCQKAQTIPRIRLAKSAERPACRVGRAYPRHPGSSQAPPMPGIRSKRKKVGMRLGQAPSSAEEGGRAPQQDVEHRRTKGDPHR